MSRASQSEDSGPPRRREERTDNDAFSGNQLEEKLMSEEFVDGDSFKVN